MDEWKLRQLAAALSTERDHSRDQVHSPGSGPARQSRDSVGITPVPITEEIVRSNRLENHGTRVFVRTRSDRASHYRGNQKAAARDLTAVKRHTIIFIAALITAVVWGALLQKILFGG